MFNSPTFQALTIRRRESGLVLICLTKPLVLKLRFKSVELVTTPVAKTVCFASCLDTTSVKILLVSFALKIDLPIKPKIKTTCSTGRNYVHRSGGLQ